MILKTNITNNHDAVNVFYYNNQKKIKHTITIGGIENVKLNKGRNNMKLSKIISEAKRPDGGSFNTDVEVQVNGAYYLLRGSLEFEDSPADPETNAGPQSRITGFSLKIVEPFTTEEMSEREMLKKFPEVYKAVNAYLDKKDFGDEISEFYASLEPDYDLLNDRT